MSIAKKYRDAFTIDGAQREMVADFFGEIMFNGKKYRTQTAQALADETFLTMFDESEIAEFEASSMAALAEIAEYKPNIFQQIVDWVKRIILKLRGTRIKADGILADELERNIKILEDYVKQVYNSRDTKKAAENGGVMYKVTNDITYKKYFSDIDDIYMSDNISRKGQYIEVCEQTPNIIVQKAKAKNLLIAMQFDTAYLETRKDGKLKGNYHNLGPDNMKMLPEMLESPEYIIQLPNGRLNIIVSMSTEKGSQALISVELEQPKQVKGKFNKYNLILTAFGAKTNYLENIINRAENTVLYNKKAESQGTDRLHKWSDGINDSTNNNIPNSTENVNTEKSNDNNNDNIKRRPMGIMSNIFDI